MMPVFVTEVATKIICCFLKDIYLYHVYMFYHVALSSTNVSYLCASIFGRRILPSIRCISVDFCLKWSISFSAN